jgi:protein-tyrosine phosphatase
VKRVLFVCLGNICRSPLAHGLFRDEIGKRGLSDTLSVDSCGTSAYHNGQGADPNNVRVALTHGVDLRDMVSRRLQDSDFFEFDILVAMDSSNERDMRNRQLPGSGAQIVLFMDFVPGADSSDVPDPYWGGADGFEHVFQLVRSGVGPLMEHVLSLPDQG